MNKVGYPYDNAAMGRYFNTLKNEFYPYKYDICMTYKNSYMR